MVHTIGRPLALTPTAPADEQKAPPWTTSPTAASGASGVECSGARVGAGICRRAGGVVVRAGVVVRPGVVRGSGVVPTVSTGVAVVVAVVVGSTVTVGVAVTVGVMVVVAVTYTFKPTTTQVP